MRVRTTIGVCDATYWDFTNCSTGVRVTVEGSEGGSPDLIVHAPLVSHKSVIPGGRFSFRVQVENIGTGPAAATTRRYYRSDDATIDATDTQLTVGFRRRQAVGQKWSSTYHWNVPFEEGTYYYGFCVDPTLGETNTDNNCSIGVPIIVEGSEEGSPDLIVVAPSTLDHRPTTGEFRLWATVRNIGTGVSDETTVRYYRSDDATIDATDTPIGTDAVSSLTAFNGLVSGPGSRLAASGTSRKSISVSAPSSPGTYYYGACVDAVPGEANTDNNCSTGAYVRVVPSGDDPFNIELVFVGDFTDARKDVMQQVARHWETIITEGLSDVNFSANPHSLSFGDGTIVVDDTVDDLRIFVYKSATEPVGRGGAVLYAVRQPDRSASHRPYMDRYALPCPP